MGRIFDFIYPKLIIIKLFCNKFCTFINLKSEKNLAHYELKIILYERKRDRNFFFEREHTFFLLSATLPLPVMSASAKKVNASQYALQTTLVPQIKEFNNYTFAFYFLLGLNSFNWLREWYQSLPLLWTLNWS